MQMQLRQMNFTDENAPPHFQLRFILTSTLVVNLLGDACLCKICCSFIKQFQAISLTCVIIIYFMSRLFEALWHFFEVIVVSNFLLGILGSKLFFYHSICNYSCYHNRTKTF